MYGVKPSLELKKTSLISNVSQCSLRLWARLVCLGFII